MRPVRRSCALLCSYLFPKTDTGSYRFSCVLNFVHPKNIISFSSVDHFYRNEEKHERKELIKSRNGNFFKQTFINSPDMGLEPMTLRLKV